MRGTPEGEPAADPRAPVSLWVIAREWTRIGCIGFGGPPTHIALLRRLCVTERRWLSSNDFEDGIAATNLLPGPASTQLSIFCAWRLRGALGGLLGGFCFIAPGLVLILALSALFLASHAPREIRGAAAGAGAAVAAVALNAALGLMPASWRRIGSRRAERSRWLFYALSGAAGAATVGPFLVLILLAAGLVEVAVRRGWPRPGSTLQSVAALPLLVAAIAGSVGALVWEAFKVGALSYGGGFVIIPLMQTDVVHTYHWMTGPQFLNAVALGQVTPGPVVQTVAVVGYAAAGLGGGLLAALFAFAPSFAFVLLGGRHFDRIRANPAVQAFLTGAGPAAIGAIAGAALPLGLSLTQLWQIGVLGAALIWMLGLRRNVVVGLIAAALVGVAVSLVGVPVGG